MVDDAGGVPVVLGAVRSVKIVIDLVAGVGEGDIFANASLTFEALDIAVDGLRITAYSAELGSASQDALNLLASWAATLDQADTAHATGSA